MIKTSESVVHITNSPTQPTRLQHKESRHRSDIITPAECEGGRVGAVPTLCCANF